MIGEYLFELGKSIAVVLLTAFIAFGGFSGIANLATWRWKTKFEADMKADFDNKLEAFKAKLQTATDELSQTLTEKITRRSKAFELQINKEYEFYEKYGTCLEKLINSSREIDKSLDNENGKENPNDELLIDKYDALYKAYSELEGITLSHSIYLDDSLFNCLTSVKISICDYCNFVTDSMFRIHRKEKIDKLKDSLNSVATVFVKNLAEASDIISNNMNDAKKMK